MLNALHNATNPYQTPAKRVLCVCSAGLLRSPTAAVIFAQEPYNFNTRSCGIDTGHALVPISEILLHWAEEIICMDEWQEARLRGLIKKYRITEKPIINLYIGDIYSYMDEELIQKLKENYNEATKTKEA